MLSFPVRRRVEDGCEFAWPPEECHGATGAPKSENRCGEVGVGRSGVLETRRTYCIVLIRFVDVG